MVRRLFWCLAAAVALECVWLSVRVFAARLGERAGDSDFDSSAIVAGAVPSGAKVAFLCRDGEFLGSCQRASLIGLDWALLPRVAMPLPSESVADWDGDVVVEVRCAVGAAVLVTALSLLAGAVLISFSTCPDREWLYEMTLPRYALLCVLPMLLSGTWFAGAEESLSPQKRG